MPSFPRPIVALTVAFALAACQEPTAPAEDTTGAVTPQPIAPVQVTWTFCAPHEENLFAFAPPAWLAVQDGVGAWQRIAPSGNSYTFTLTHDRGGVAFASVDGFYRFVTVVFAGTSELAAGPPNCTFPASVGSVVGSVSDTTGGVALALGWVWRAFNDAAFEIPAVPGTLVATHWVDLQPGRTILRRGLTGAGSVGTLDFAPGGESHALTAQAVTIAPLEGSCTNMSITTIDSVHVPGTSTALGFEQSSALSRSSAPLPAAALLAGELQSLTARVQCGPVLQQSQRAVTSYYRTPSDRTLAFGPAAGPIAATHVAGAAHFRPRFTWTRQPSYDGAWLAQLSDYDGFRWYQLRATAAYMAGVTGTAALTMPDLSRVAGWQADYAIPGNARGVGWYFRAHSHAELFATGRAAAYAADGVTVRWAAEEGDLLPLDDR